MVEHSWNRAFFRKIIKGFLKIKKKNSKSIILLFYQGIIMHVRQFVCSRCELTYAIASCNCKWPTISPNGGICIMEYHSFNALAWRVHMPLNSIRLKNKYNNLHKYWKTRWYGLESTCFSRYLAVCRTTQQRVGWLSTNICTVQAPAVNNSFCEHNTTHTPICSYYTEKLWDVNTC